MHLAGTSTRRRMRFFAPWMDLTVVGFSFEVGGFPLYGEDGIRRGHPRVRDGLVRVDDPVVPVLKNHVECRSKDRPQARTNPVHPVCSEREPGDDRRSKRTRSVHSTASVVYRPEFTNKESKPDPDRRERGHLVFFDGEHEDRENQIRSNEHFDEHSLGGIDPSLQASVVATRARRERQNDPSGSDCADKLSDAIQHKPHRTDDSRKEQRQTDIRVEQSTGDAVEQPRRHQETETKVDRGDEDVERIRGRLADAACGRCRLDSSIGESEEEEGADELEKSTAEVLFDVREETTDIRTHLC